ncbi:MAG TPA: hypothetical protein PKE12_09715 [Kiritimatiellia bacterium]|nr:hypothetical protein [Kiritimatiellia bacterium]
MNSAKRILCALLLTVAVWLPLSWPLPSLFTEALPVGVAKRENPRFNIVHMMPGDHLQFLYYMWLCSDYLSGDTRFFYNLYEFNTGDDEERYRPGSYYFPYSFAFSAFHAVGNQAFAWNAVSLLALWLACWFTWLLGLRYTRSEAIAAIGAMLALLFPYQWIQLFGGSPAGFGMTFVPLLLLGLDIAVRDERMRGGWMAGFALLFASTTDNHAFFFSALMVPCWCIVAFTQRSGFDWRKPAAYGRLLRALSPVILLAVLALMQTKMGTRHIQQSHAAGGRTPSEVALFSPKAEGLWAWREIDVSYHIYFGYLIVAVLAAGLLLHLARAWRTRTRDDAQRAALIGLVCLGVTGIILLCMGPFSPWDGRLFTAARKYIPNYTMIRQPAKIFVLLPALLAVGVVLTLKLATDAWGRRARWVIALVAAGFAVEYFFQTKLLISRIDESNAAYAAAADDARARARDPRAIILPLWPGDSHYTSVYQYYITLYRIRMINGYRPFVPAEYIRDVFERYRTLNLGIASDAQLDSLMARGIDHVILHEDLYPEKVSAFPIGTALAGLLNHPRLAVLAQEGPVWSFRILPSGEQRPAVATNWTYHFPARRIEAERQDLRETARVEEDGASGRAFIRLAGNSRLSTRPLSAIAPPQAQWWVRVRGNGTLRADRLVASQSIGHLDLAVEFDRWEWLEIPAGSWDAAPGVVLSLAAVDGAIDVDVMHLAAGDWRALEPGETLEIPAPCFFHAGHTDLARDAVIFVPERDRRDIVFYGPKQPLQPGRYRIAMEGSVTASRNGVAGTWIASCPDAVEIGRVNMIAGEPAAMEIIVPENLPFLLAFIYAGTEAVELRGVAITRLD